jgi:putative spermidine/putrescine transport system substrate-binding protein
MMKRRSFLIGASALALGQLISGCNRQQQASLNVRLLQDSIPVLLLNQFRKVLKQPNQLNFDPEEQLNDLFLLLQHWKQQAGKKDAQQGLPIPFIGRRTPEVADLVTLGDYWLEKAIQGKLIQPLELEDLKGWQQLPSRWQELVRRNDQGQLDKDGQVWGAPYRWGTTVIAYRRDKFRELGWTPKDWSDLWRKELRDRISLLDNSRAVIGLTLKKLGFSYNTKDLSQVPNLKEELLALHRQVKYYSSDTYLEPLLLGDTWLAVGWSSDVLSVRANRRQIDAVVPQSGTALWTELWVQPTSVAAESKAVEKGDGTSSRPDAMLRSHPSVAVATSDGGNNRTSASPTQPADTNANPSLTKQWIEFCWQPQLAKEISILSNAASPIITSIAPDNLPKALRENRLLLPDSSVLDKSEFLAPLPQPVFEKYQALWKEIRRSNISS